MHELSLAYSVVELIERELSQYTEGSLQGIEMAIGSLSGIDEDAFVFAMEIVLAHTPFAGTELNINRVKAQSVCRQCGKNFSPKTMYDSCPRCGSFASRHVAGQEFKLTALTVEV